MKKFSCVGNTFGGKEILTLLNEKVDKTSVMVKTRNECLDQNCESLDFILGTTC